MVHCPVASSAGTPPLPSWVEMKSDKSMSAFIDWEALRKIAVAEKQRASTNKNVDIACKLSAACSEGGLHIVRRLEFSDGDIWIARVQKTPPSADSCKRLLHEVYTIRAIQQQSNVPVPKILAYRTAEDNPVRAAFTIQQYVHADTGMNVLGEGFSKKAQITAGWEERYYKTMARIQADMSSVRFSMIGCITETSNGYSVGPIPGIGGPFETPADFFAQWATGAVFPFSKDKVKRRTPPEHFEEVWNSLAGFPLQVAKFAKSYNFRRGPFPVIHGDLYRSNILMDNDCNVKAIIDWEDAIVAPWELVEFIKDLGVVPAAMNGSSHQEPPSVRERRNKRETYIKYVEEIEKKQLLDGTLSMVLSNSAVQDFAHAFWLWHDGKVGFYKEIGLIQ
ncbi:uncharacterized protein EKO05_0003191 [Ascochyta rabiei]|uniref:Transferase n=1 Tax=Didymella rabiei TaxID=5454 RepID=A0A162WPS9_DIDRA|nr:uncharacterized protein EKO05_0003191 [Ascochyta rabiei]KZM19152.1 transferase [Ascochyta rabiei]UPX12650.1 hypothetical protein EKO05_0003191 [Ascochyta rabiei]